MNSTLNGIVTFKFPYNSNFSSLYLEINDSNESFLISHLLFRQQQCRSSTAQATEDDCLLGKVENLQRENGLTVMRKLEATENGAVWEEDFKT